jgi:hypothetical protein
MLDGVGIPFRTYAKTEALAVAQSFDKVITDSTVEVSDIFFE